MPSDVIVIGAGHNALVAAAYLARAGLRTVVLERRSMVGGACVTEELWPGFRISRAAYVAGLIRPAVIRELGLRGRGLRLLKRDPSSFTPLPGDRGLLIGADAAATHREIERFSVRDAGRYPDYERLLDGIARTLEPMLDAPPPDFAHFGWRDIAPLLRLGRGALRLRGDLPRALALLLGPARRTLEAWFESEPLRSTLATDAVIGAFSAPSSPGTGYVLFHHVMGETNGERGVWAYVEGGMGRFSDAIADAAREAGAEIRTESPVAKINIKDGGVAGVTLEDGSVLEAGTVVSGADPHVTLIGLVGSDHLPPEYSRQIEALDFRSPSLKINMALDRLPHFPERTGPTPGPEHSGTIHIGASSLDELDAAFEAARRGQLPERPLIELTLPSAIDPSLAPAGHHVASMFIQYAPYALAAASWETERERFADRVFSLVDEVAPGFSASVLHREVLAPPDLERIFALTGGNIFHGAMSLDRLFFMRPVPGYSRHQTPLRGLYLCGAGTHPGGGVMGACGRNAAFVILRSLRGRRQGTGASF